MQTLPAPISWSNAPRIQGCSAHDSRRRRFKRPLGEGASFVLLSSATGRAQRRPPVNREKRAQYPSVAAGNPSRREYRRNQPMHACFATRSLAAVGMATFAVLFGVVSTASAQDVTL